MRRGRAGRPGPADGWQRLSCADGSKGPRLYDWALIGDGQPAAPPAACAGPSHRARKASSSWPSSAAGHPARSPCPSSSAVAGASWGVEDCFAEAKNEAGLDHYQVRKYRAWYRHATLSMLAHAFLAVAARASARHLRRRSRQRGTPAPTPLKRGPDTCGQLFAPPRTYAPPAFIKDETGRDLIPLTAAEARRLFNLHNRTARAPAFHEQWSHWRRRRQAAARKSHYARRARINGPDL